MIEYRHRSYQGKGATDNMKKKLNPGTMLSPIPAVMVSCAKAGEKPNIITIAWTGGRGRRSE